MKNTSRIHTPQTFDITATLKSKTKKPQKNNYHFISDWHSKAIVTANYHSIKQHNNEPSTTKLHKQIIATKAKNLMHILLPEYHCKTESARLQELELNKAPETWRQSPTDLRRVIFPTADLPNFGVKPLAVFKVYYY